MGKDARALMGLRAGFLDSGRKWGWKVRSLVFPRRMRAGVLCCRARTLGMDFWVLKGNGAGVYVLERDWDCGGPDTHVSLVWP